MRTGSDMATSLSRPSWPPLSHPSASVREAIAIILERSLPVALYQQYISLPFFLLNHPLAIGFPPLATETAVWHCTVRKLWGQGPTFRKSERLASPRGHSVVPFGQPESPHPSSAA